VPPEKTTIYCFEQSTMKYLAECKNNISHNEDDDEYAQKNWQRSVKSTKELVGYLCSLEPHSLAVMMSHCEYDDIYAQKNWQRSVQSTKKLVGYLCSLEPHSLAVMMSINDAINVVSMMSKLVLDTMVCIFEDEKDVEEKKNEAERLKKEITRHPQQSANHELITLSNVNTKRVYKCLGHTDVVCESGRCSVVEEEHIVHQQVCCKSCRVGGWIMYFCSNIDWLGNCKICGCNKSHHRWSTTKTTVVKEPFYPPVTAALGRVVDGDDELKKVNQEISLLENRVRNCKYETEQMIEICAKLSVFVHENASLGTSSTDDQLLRCLENERQKYASSPDKSREDNGLADIQSQYVQHLKTAKDHRYSAEEVPELIEQLCNLPMKGQYIKTVVGEYEKYKDVRRCNRFGIGM